MHKSIDSSSRVLVLALVLPIVVVHMHNVMHDINYCSGLEVAFVRMRSLTKHDFVTEVLKPALNLQSFI